MVPRPEGSSSLGPKRVLPGFVPGRLCKASPRLARTVPSSALALPRHPGQRRPGAPTPTQAPLPLRQASTPEERLGGSGGERPQESFQSPSPCFKLSCIVWPRSPGPTRPCFFSHPERKRSRPRWAAGGQPPAPQSRIPRPGLGPGTHRGRQGSAMPERSTSPTAEPRDLGTWQRLLVGVGEGALCPHLGSTTCLWVPGKKWKGRGGPNTWGNILGGNPKTPRPEGARK